MADPIPALMDLKLVPAALEEVTSKDVLAAMRGLAPSAVGGSWQPTYKQAVALASAVLADADRQAAELQVALARIQQREASDRRLELPSAAVDALSRKLDTELREAYEQSKRRIDEYAQLYRKLVPQALRSGTELEMRQNGGTLRVEPSDAGWANYQKWLLEDALKAQIKTTMEIWPKEYEPRIVAWRLELARLLKQDLSYAEPEQRACVLIDVENLGRPAYEKVLPSFAGSQWVRILGLFAATALPVLGRALGRSGLLPGLGEGGVASDVSLGSAGVLLTTVFAAVAYYGKTQPAFVTKHEQEGTQRVKQALAELADNSLAKQAEFLRIWLDGTHRAVKSMARDVLEGVTFKDKPAWPAQGQRVRELDRAAMQRASEAAEAAIRERLAIQSKLQALDRARVAYLASTLEPLRKRLSQPEPGSG